MSEFEWAKEELLSMLRGQLNGSDYRDVHPAVIPLWNTFLHLHATRQSSGFGPNPVKDVDVLAYCTLRGTKFEAWELEAIFALDREMLMHTNKNGDKDRVINQPLSPKIFDGIFN